MRDKELEKIIGPARDELIKQAEENEELKERIAELGRQEEQEWQQQEYERMWREENGNV